MLPTILLACLAATLFGVLGSGVLLLLPEKRRHLFTPLLVAFAVGALLGAALLVLMPSALAGHWPAESVLALLLAGLLIFFFGEKVLLWHHCHEEGCPVHAPRAGHSGHAAAILVLFGDALHNLVDGVVIAAAFLADPQLGVSTTLAVVAHELPHEVGDVAVLLAAGFRPRRALLLNLLSGLTALLGGALGYLALSGLERLLPLALAVAAGGFIYIAVADLLPQMHERPQARSTVAQALFIGLGLAAVHLAHEAAH